MSGVLSTWVALCFALLAAASPTLDGSEVELGKRLFEDKHLSSDGQLSCATCHDPSRAFTDGRPVAIGAYGRSGTRNAPSLLEASHATVFTWDGRRSTMEAQIHDAFLNPKELDLASDAELQQRLPPHVGPAEAIAALTAYVRSLTSGPSAFDRYQAGDHAALGPAEQRGLDLFRGRARCAECHVMESARASFTDQGFHRVDIENPAVQRQLADLVQKMSALPEPDRLNQIPLDPQVAALGRFNVTLDPRDISAFRTPSLRDVARTAPYFHDGRVPTLEEAVAREIYYRDEERHLVLDPTERADLVAFLRSLSTSENQ